MAYDPYLYSFNIIINRTESLQAYKKTIRSLKCAIVNLRTLSWVLGRLTPPSSHYTILLLMQLQYTGNS